MANIKVAIRVRPISEREIHFTGSEIVVHSEEKAISLTNLKVSSSKAGDSRERTRKYGFDYCFDSSDPRDDKYASQSKIYETLGESILEVLFNGFNSCLVAYGQSASGKTYTMMGSKEDPGLTPRICEGLFLRLANEEKSDTNFDVSVSYLEVYNERVRDLLRPSASSLGLRVREHPRLGPYVQGLTHHSVSTLGSLISRVEEGTRARKTASTLQNPTSSRSHALLTLSLRPSSSNIGQSTTDTSRNVSRPSEHCPGGSKLHLVDLAGSESAAACGGINRLKEGANINKSLVALGNVISALAERGSSGIGPGRRFIPYRDSALTWLLKDALGGNATTIMLATISPASGSYNETSHTLRFAQRAQSVVNRPVINEDPVSRIIKELRAEVSRLKSLLVVKSVDPDRKFTCTCQYEQEPESNTQDQEARVVERNELDEGKLRGEEEHEALIGEIHLGITERRHSTSESLLPCNELSGLVPRFGSFGIARESRKLSLGSIESDNYNRAKVSELIIDDQIDEPVFVDIPTLVAVLIKPDDNVHVGSHQIEEISSDGVPEDVIDEQFSDNVKDHSLPVSSVLQDSKSDETPIIQCSEVRNDPTESQENLQPSDEAISNNCVKGKLEKNDSIDSELATKKSLALQSSKKYGSIESLPRKREIAWSFQRSETNLDKRNGSLDRIKKLNNIKEIEDQRAIKLATSWRNIGGLEGRDFQRKGSNDSDKSLKESALLARSKNQVRKQSIDGLKRKTSKDSSSSSSKDELSINCGGQTREISRKGSLEHDQPPTRTHTPIQRARRAEIVAAVTERLYSSKKLLDDTSALTGTTASTPNSEVRSPESTDVNLASSTRMRLQEISRKMLAKRRRVCVDTQTDNYQTVRVKDASSITEEPKIISKDASVLTDQHENYEIPPSIDPVRRVKEIATSTDFDLSQPIIRCKDAANLTDQYYDDYATANSPRNDSGVMSDDTQYYAESNLSSGEISDLSPMGAVRCVELMENSTNTAIPSVSMNTGSQTRSEDLGRAARCLDCDARFCSGRHHCRSGPNISERNVISISLPEMVNITIETSNGMESKIKVFDGNETIDERAMISLKDSMVQTETRDVLEVSTSTDDASGRVYFHNFSTSTKPMIGQNDGKTFRIENIFHEPHVSTRNNPKIDIIDDSLEDVAGVNSLIVTNSVGTSFVPETRENATGMEARSYSSEIFLGTAARRSLPGMTNTWPSRWTSTSDNRRKKAYQDYSSSGENKQTLSDISMNELHRRHDPDNVLFQKDHRQPLLESNGQILDDRFDIGLGNSTRTPNQEFLKTRREEPKDCSVTGLKSSSIIATLDRQGNGEQETNFSDDSLDLDDHTSRAGKNESIRESNSSTLKDELSTVNEKVCPPDLVAHTKKDTIESSIPLDHFDEFDDEEQHIELPKTKVESIAATAFPTPLNSFKTLILGDPSCTLHHANDSYLTDFPDQSSAALMDQDYFCSSIDVVEDMEQCLVNGGRSVAPRSIIKKTTDNSNGMGLTVACQLECGTKNLRNKSSYKKKVRFAMPVVSLMTSSDDESCDDTTKDFAVSGERNILEEYLDEAVAFMRNMNSMNEYMSATKASGKSTTNARNRRRDKAKGKNYIEYEGRRISLEDDTSESVKSKDDDDLNFNVESYDKCLRSMDRLEECLVRARRHDEILRHKYGVGMNGSTGAKLDLAKFSVDSSDADKDSNDGSNLNDAGLRRNNVAMERDEIDDGNNNPLPWMKEEGFSSERSLTISDNLKKLRARRFSRVSELRKRNQATYSQLRTRYVSQAVDPLARMKEDCSPTSVEPTKADGSEDNIVPDALQAPNCFLVLPKSTRNDVGPSDRFKDCTSRQRFSLSKYDSSNESSSSNEALASFVESMDNVTRTKNKIRYPGSPRAKFLQLLSERRRIVENTRSTGAS